jgi:hypothetical protein
MTADETMPRRILVMVHELHRRGYERLRVAPSLFASGRWMCGITPVTNISYINGAWEREPSLAVYYTNSQGAQCFDWTDAADDTPEQLATKFIDHFPELSEQGRGGDEAYALWYSEMLKGTEPAGLIFAQDGWVMPDDEIVPTGISEDVIVPPPPEGEAAPQA